MRGGRREGWRERGGRRREKTACTSRSRDLFTHFLPVLRLFGQVWKEKRETVILVT